MKYHALVVLSFSLTVMACAAASPVQRPVATVVAPPAPPVARVPEIWPDPPPVPELPPTPPDPRVHIGKDTRLLVFGDSMVNTGIGAFFKRRVEKLGGNAATDSVASSSARSWNKGKRIEWLLEQSHPDVVVIVLGANEVYLPFPEATASDIRSIVQRLGDRTCVWVGPPVWKRETGVVEVQHANSGPCTYFDTQGLKLTRQPDGIHPDYEGGRAWGAAVWNALFAEKDAVNPAPQPTPTKLPNPTRDTSSPAVSSR